MATSEVAVCTRCHTLIHAGLLVVSGDPFEALTWRPGSDLVRVGTSGRSWRP